MEFIDSHSHLLWPTILDSIEEIIHNAQKNNIQHIVNCGTQIDDFLPCKNLKARYPVIENIIGIHPEFSLQEKNNFESFASIMRANASEFCAIGEIGLDYISIKDHAERKKTETIFESQIELAIDLNLPIVIHCRNAEKQAIKILEKPEYSDLKGVIMHCFGGCDKHIRQCLGHDNWFFSIPTSVIFRTLHQNLARIVPIERQLLETDAPFLSPFPDAQINVPHNVRYAAETIANIKELSVASVAAITTKNAQQFFNL